MYVYVYVCVYIYIYIYIYIIAHFRTVPIQQVKGLAHCSIEGLKAHIKSQ